MIVDNPQHFQVLAFQSDINKIFTQDICTEHCIVFCYFESVYDRNEAKFYTYYKNASSLIWCLLEIFYIAAKKFFVNK